MEHVERIKERYTKRVKQHEEFKNRTELSDEDFNKYALDTTIEFLRDKVKELYMETVQEKKVSFKLDVKFDKIPEDAALKYKPGGIGYDASPCEVILPIISPRFNAFKSFDEYIEWLIKLFEGILPTTKNFKIVKTIELQGWSIDDTEYIDTIYD